MKAFLGDRALTTSQLADELADVPTGSLYRHVGLLAKAGVLHVVAERRVRATVERTYTLRLAATGIGPGEAAMMTREDHAQAFLAYVAGLLADADRYLASPSADVVRNGFGYHTAAMWLTDAELAEFARELQAIVQPRLANAPGKGRKRQMIYSVFLPGPETQAPKGAATRGGARSRPRTKKA